MREYISPNWHAILIHAPLGLLSVGIILELMGFLWRRSGLRPAARWMILVGAVTSVPALTSGIYAYRDVISSDTTGNVTFQDKWTELLENNVKDRSGDTKIVDVPVSKWLTKPAGELLRMHIIYNAAGVGAVFLVVILWIALTDRWRRRLYLPLLLILVAGKGLLIYGSHDAGQAVYVHATAIEPPTPPGTMTLTPQEKLMQVMPPAQLHFTMAGGVVAIALVALALSIRAITQAGVIETETGQDWFDQKDPGSEAPAVVVKTTVPVDSGFDPVAGDPTNPIPLSTERTALVEPMRSTAPTTTVLVTPESVPSSRFWVLAFLLGLITIASGLWIIGFWTWNDKWHDLQQMLRGERRNYWHSIVGTSIVVLTAILAILTRVAARNKMLLSIFATLLFAALGAQVWLGILLTFDGPKGPPTGYNNSDTKHSDVMISPTDQGICAPPSRVAAVANSH